MYKNPQHLREARRPFMSLRHIVEFLLPGGPANMRAFIFLLALILAAQRVDAAELQLRANDTPTAGTSIVITVSLDTQGESINALEGVLLYPRDNLKLREIRDGNSLINFWAERPHDAAGGIRFAGITPGGYEGSGREVFSLLFDVLKTGDVHFSLSSARALRNDGNGTPVPLTLSKTTVILNDTESQPSIEGDTTPPEDFMPYRGDDPTLFGGKTFVVFATQDKQSGIDQYEVAEKKGFRRPPFLFSTLHWEHAESPYVLKDQTKSAFVYVRGLDRAGNERVVVLSPEHLPIRYNPALYIGILLILLVVRGVYARLKPFS